MATSILYSLFNLLWQRVVIFRSLIDNGDGTFSDETATRLPGQSEALKNGLNPPFLFLADLDGDGHKDLLAKFFADDYKGNTFPTRKIGKQNFTRMMARDFSRLCQREIILMYTHSFCR